MTNPLLDAAKAGDRDAVRALLDRDPALALEARRAAGGAEAPIMAALYRGHADLANELADRSTSPEMPLDLFSAAALGRDADLDAALARGERVDGVADDGWTPLHLAAFFGHRAACERLLEAGADLRAVSRNAMANTPLHAAVAGGHVDSALLLIERGAEVNATDAGGHSPLHIAAEAGYVPVVRALLARGADPHLVDAEERTPLARAAARNHEAVVDLINLDR